MQYICAATQGMRVYAAARQGIRTMVCRLFQNYFVSVGKTRDNISAIFNKIGAIFGQKSS